MCKENYYSQNGLLSRDHKKLCLLCTQIGRRENWIKKGYRIPFTTPWKKEYYCKKSTFIVPSLFGSNPPPTSANADTMYIFHGLRQGGGGGGGESP